MSMFQRVSGREGLNEIDNGCMKLLDFKRLLLGPGTSHAGNSGKHEILLLILGGRCSMTVGKKEFADIGGRANVFGGKPWSVYVPSGNDYRIAASAAGSVEIALCMASSDLKTEPYLIKPDQVTDGKWGETNFTRFYYSVLDQRTPAQRLFVGETYVPSGNWATYPPHKHEKDDLPNEVFMEEIYYYKVAPPEGFALDRHYTDESVAGAFDRADVIKNESILLMPRGYHTTVVAPGYQLYYLWFLAGNIRQQCPKLDPVLGWVQKTLPIIENSRKNL